jgi:glycosyltransferase involved in cell wall biosynthesis
MLAMSLDVDLSIFGSRSAGVALYAVAMARFLEEKEAANVICPGHWSAHFSKATVCPDPLRFRNAVLFRHPHWSRQLSRGARLYCPHGRLALGVRDQVITLHDTLPYLYPTRNPVEWLYYRVLLPARIHGLSGVFTVSETSKNDIINRFGLDPSKVHLVPNGIDLQIWSKGHQPVEKQPYILSVSANRPYKNTLELIDHHPLWAGKFKLKILGSKARYGEAIRARVAHHGLGNRVEFLEDLDLDEVVRLYRHATALVYPSLAEGFGRPPLEAMAVGCPAIISDIPVHLETYRQSGIFISPGSPESWVQAFAQLDLPEVLAERQAAGYVIADRFSLTEATSRLLMAFREVWPDRQAA